MKNLILLVFLILVFACNKQHEELEFTYDFKISRTFYSNEIRQDSIVYFYNNNNQLLRVEKSPFRGKMDEYNVHYHSNLIDSWNGKYFINENNQIIKCLKQDSQIDFLYKNELLICEKRTFNNIITDEYFYIYDGVNLLKDSTVHHNSNDGKDYITVYNSVFTDTIVPAFVPHYSGLYEIPKKSQYLVKEKKSHEHGISYKYSYELHENEMIQHIKFFDTHKKLLDEKIIIKLITKE